MITWYAKIYSITINELINVKFHVSHVKLEYNIKCLNVFELNWIGSSFKSRGKIGSG